MYTVLVLRMAHRIRKETKQEPCTAGPGNMLGCCLVSFHFLWAILSTSTVQGVYSVVELFIWCQQTVFCDQVGHPVGWCWINALKPLLGITMSYDTNLWSFRGRTVYQDGNLVEGDRCGGLILGGQIERREPHVLCQAFVSNNTCISLFTAGR